MFWSQNAEKYSKRKTQSQVQLASCSAPELSQTPADTDFPGSYEDVTMEQMPVCTYKYV